MGQAFRLYDRGPYSPSDLLVLSYLIRNRGGNLYQDPTYRNIAVLLMVIDVLVSVLFGSFKNVMKRGYFKGFTMMIKHVILVELSLAFYLFL